MKKEKEIGTLKASRDYWKEKAEKMIKENAILKSKLKNAELELKILGHCELGSYEATEQQKRTCPYGKGIREII